MGFSGTVFEINSVPLACVLRAAPIMLVITRRLNRKFKEA